MSGSEQEIRKDEADFPFHPSSLLPPPPPYQPPTSHLTSSHHTSHGLLHSTSLPYPGHEFPVTPPRRGPGRPRKDGMSPVIRRKP